MKTPFKTFIEIVEDHDGRVFDKWESYLAVYESELLPYRNTKGSIMELGVQNCGSLEVWSKYFENANIILGVDIVEEIGQQVFEDKRVVTLIQDATTLEYKTLKTVGISNLQVVIDDASHRSLDIIQSFLQLFPLLEDYGLYIIEDLCCSYWKGFNDDEIIPAMEFFKEMVDCINKEHWHESRPVKVLDILRAFNIEEERLKDISDSIFSIRFYNSMCCIVKSAHKPSYIGNRFVHGSHAPLGAKEVHGQNISVVKSSAN